MKTLDNRFYVKFMQLEIGLLCDFKKLQFISKGEDISQLILLDLQT